MPCALSAQSVLCRCLQTRQRAAACKDRPKSAEKSNNPHLALNLTRILVVHCASHTYTCSENFLHRSLQLPRTAPVPHNPCNLNDLFHLQIAAVLDVFLLQGGPIQSPRLSLMVCKHRIEESRNSTLICTAPASRHEPLTILDLPTRSLRSSISYSHRQACAATGSGSSSSHCHTSDTRSVQMGCHTVV